MKEHNYNPMHPYLGKLAGIKELGTDIRLFQIELADEAGKEAFADYRPGQFGFVSAFGEGEAPFGITSIPAQDGSLEFAIHRHPHGKTTGGLHNLSVGDPIGVRVRWGITSPWKILRGRTSLFWAVELAARLSARS